MRLEDPFRCGRASTGRSDRDYHLVDHAVSTDPPYQTLCGALLVMPSIALMMTIPDVAAVCRPCANLYRQRMYEANKQQNGTR